MPLLCKQDLDERQMFLGDWFTFKKKKPKENNARESTGLDQCSDKYIVELLFFFTHRECTIIPGMSVCGSRKRDVIVPPSPMTGAILFFFNGAKVYKVF